MDYNLSNATVHCCAECGNEGGASLKACMSCKLVKYCNAKCQKKHWSKHKKICKQRAGEIYDEKLFKDPPAKEDCPICFLPMPVKMISCVSLPPATLKSVPIYDYVKNEATEELANTDTKHYYSCCGKSICGGCLYSFTESGNDDRCPFCNSDRDKTDEEQVEELMMRVDVNDAGAMYVLGSYYYHGNFGLLQDRAKAMELWKKAAKLGSSHAHFNLGNEYHGVGDLKKAKFRYEAAAMAGHEAARNNLGTTEHNSGNVKQAVKHWTIAVSAGHHKAMNALLLCFKQGAVSRHEIDLTLTAYNKSCAEVRSEARDAYINMCIDVGRRL